MHRWKFNYEQKFKNKILKFKLKQYHSDVEKSSVCVRTNKSNERSSQKRHNFELGTKN